MREADNLPVPLSRNLGTLTSWNPLVLSRPVMGHYLYRCVNLPSRTILSSSSIYNILNDTRSATLHACRHGTYNVYVLLHDHITLRTAGDNELPGTFMNTHYSNAVLIRQII